MGIVSKFTIVAVISKLAVLEGISKLANEIWNFTEYGWVDLVGRADFTE